MSYVPASVALTGSDRILQGATYYREFALTVSAAAVDLTSWSGANKGVRCQFRTEASSGTVILTPTMTIKSPPTAGILTMTIGSDVTTAMTQTSGVYDIELYDTNTSPPTVERVVQGSWAMEVEVTR